MERSCEPMDKNRIEGAAKQGERARFREALVIKAKWRKSSGCAAKACVLTRGDLALCLKGRRGDAEREVSRGRSSASKGAKGRTRRRVRDHANKGAAGVDGLDIDQTARHLVTAWPALRERLLRGTYRPSPVRRVTILKPDGGSRELGIPTVTDRLIQPALLQVLQPRLAPTFSEHSYGFRPLGDVRTTRSLRRKRTCNRGGASWWMLIWRRSSTTTITASSSAG